MNPDDIGRGRRGSIGSTVGADSKHVDADIRNAAIDDASRISELITELGYPTTAEAMRDRLVDILNDPTHATLVADRCGDVVGVAGAALSRYYEKDGLYCRLAVLAVSSSARGEGVGGRLVDGLEAWAVGEGASEMFVNSAFHRSGAHGFYERHGYSRTGFRFVKQLDRAPVRGADRSR